MPAFFSFPVLVPASKVFTNMENARSRTGSLSSHQQDFGDGYWISKQRKCLSFLAAS